MDNNSLSDTKYNCRYHIVFTPKFRRKEDLYSDGAILPDRACIIGELKKEIGKILKQLCE